MGGLPQEKPGGERAQLFLWPCRWGKNGRQPLGQLIGGIENKSAKILPPVHARTKIKKKWNNFAGRLQKEQRWTVAIKSGAVLDMSGGGGEMFAIYFSGENPKCKKSKCGETWPFQIALSLFMFAFCIDKMPPLNTICAKMTVMNWYKYWTSFQIKQKKANRDRHHRRTASEAPWGETGSSEWDNDNPRYKNRKEWKANCWETRWRSCYRARANPTVFLGGMRNHNIWLMDFFQKHTPPKQNLK